MKDQSQAKQQQAAAAAAAAQQQQQQDSNNESKSAPPPQKSTGEEKQDDQPQQQGEEEEQEESQSENEEEEEVSDEDSEEEESDDDEDLEELYQLLVGKKVNKSGMVVDKKSGATIGRLVEGKLKRVAGKKVGENGEIVNDKGKLIGRVEPIRQEDDSEDSASDSEDEEESEQVPAEGDKEEAPTTQDKEEESTKNEAEKSEGKEEEQSKNEEELPKEEDAKVDEEDTSEEQEDAKVDENDVTEDQEEEDVKKSNEEPKQSDREITDSKDADKEEGKEEKLDATENEVEDLEVGDDKPAEDAVKSGAAAAVGGAAGVISKDGSKDEEDKPTIDEDSPVVKKSGKVLDMDDNVVGHVDKRMAAKLAGFKVDSEGNVVNNEGEVVGIAEMVKPEEPEEEDKPFNPNEMVDEDSPEVKKSGKVVDMEDNIVGSVDKKLAPKLAGFKVDQNGNVINHEGHIVAKAEMIKVPDEEETVANEEPAEEENKPFNPNDMVDENSPEVRKSGKVFDMDDNLVGHVDKRIAAKYAGCKVDEEGNVINQDGHVVGKAELIKTEEEPAEEEKKPFNPNELVDEDSPEVRKSGKVFDMDDNLVGHVDKRVASKYAGCKVDPEGNVIDNEGHIVARAEMIKPEEPEEPKEEKDKPFNPYAMVDENSPEVKKSGKVLDMDDNLVGHVDKRIASKLAGCKVDGDGNIINAEGHIAGKAEMIKEEEPVEEEDKNKPFNPNTSVNEHSPEVRRSGKVVDEDDNIVGHVDKSAAHKLAGYKVDWDGNIINDEGHIVGKAEMIKQKSEEERQKEAEEEQYRRIADQMSDAIQHSLDKIKPVLKNITDTIEAEEAKSEQDRDEEKLVETVKPLIEQGSDILNEAYGAIRGLDPSGKIAKTAQGKTAERKASPEEYHLAELLSQLTGEVSTTIDKSKKKIKNMPKAKKALSPLWNILQSPLLQILSAVGLLLTGVLGLVGQLLNGLGLGGIINSLLGGIGLNKILEGFGLGNALNLASRKR